jgi:hypothetical protein
VLLDESRVRLHDAPQHERDQHCVVELARHGHEVGNEVDRERQIGDQTRDEDLVPASQSVVSQQSCEQDNAVRGEAGKRPSVLAASPDNEPEHDEGVERKRDSECIDDPFGHDEADSSPLEARSVRARCAPVSTRIQLSSAVSAGQGAVSETDAATGLPRGGNGS